MEELGSIVLIDVLEHLDRREGTKHVADAAHTGHGHELDSLAWVNMEVARRYRRDSMLL